MREVKKIETRCTIDGVMFNIGDYLVRIGRYFDRAASDASGLTFEEWTPPDGRDSFIINATELRGVNFTMTPTGELGRLPPLQSELRRSKRAPKAKVTALPGALPPPPPPPKEYAMEPAITMLSERAAGERVS